MSSDPKKSVIRPLSKTETAQFLQDYKDIFFKTLEKTASNTDKAPLYEKINNLSFAHNQIDPKCILEINKKLVRVEYPGEVKNVDKAIETLGGLPNIEASVADRTRRLELRFHSNNKYNKPCFADKDFKAGILIKVKNSLLEPQPGSSKNLQEDKNYDYEVEGVSVMNYSFNRLCDFQFLPLVAEQPESSLSKTDYIYEKIIPTHIPDVKWCIDLKNMEPFLPPVSFSQYDSPQSKLNVENNDKNDPFNLKVVSNKPAKRRQKNICRIFGKNRAQISIFVNITDVEIPTKPLDVALKFIKNRGWEEHLGRVKQLFEERPIWTKAAIQYNTGLNNDQAKAILPIVAYYFFNGPWRISWVKYGYDPRKDSKARIYQTLDYRIRTAESTTLKVTAKRNHTGKTPLMLGPGQIKKVSLNDDISVKPRIQLDERCYVLRPMSIPPARQMFYQLCDLILPEIQEMISRLPRNSNVQCHQKNGWLPENFIEKCRKVVNEHVLIAVQKELLEDKKLLEGKSKEKDLKKDNGSSTDYYNKMLTNIKQGIYKNVDLRPSGFIHNVDVEESGERINLSSDDEQEMTVGEIIQSSIPAKLDEGEESDDEEDVSDDDAEMDMEIVQEINELISQNRDE